MKTEVGTVLKVTRRHVELCDESFEVLSGKVGSRELVVCIGDLVAYSVAHGECVIEEVLPRKNCIIRSYESKSKNLAANVDHMFIVTAMPPLFNTHSIDRMLVIAAEQKVKTTLIINKVDLEQQRKEVGTLIDYYKMLGVSCIETSAERGDNINFLIDILSDSKIRIVLLCGISGVGKSSLLNKLIPHAKAHTRETSRKTGQGRQVTSSAFAHIFERKTTPALIIDLPGLQHFGVAHLSEDDVKFGFAEIVAVGQDCEFSNCAHIKEDNCAVLDLVHEGKISPFRYLSYLGMIEEIKAAKPY